MALFGTNYLGTIVVMNIGQIQHLNTRYAHKMNDARFQGPRSRSLHPDSKIAEPHLKPKRRSTIFVSVLGIMV